MNGNNPLPVVSLSVRAVGKRFDGPGYDPLLASLSMNFKLRAACLGLGVVASSLSVGCGPQAENAVKKAENQAVEAATEAKNVGVEMAKKKVVEPIQEALPKIEEKIKSLSGDDMAKAKEKLEAIKKLIAEFTEAPADKFTQIGEKLKVEFEALKKHVGL